MNEQLHEILTDIVKALAEDGAWVPVETYLAIYKGETREAVQTRRSKGLWRDGVESKFVKGSGLWINLLAVNSWAAKSPLRLASVPGSTTPESPSASASPSCSAERSARNPSQD